ncbi:MAG: hypothetical protein ACPGLY_01375 [Rubripirellula sp.]
MNSIFLTALPPLVVSSAAFLLAVGKRETVPEMMLKALENSE